MIEIPSGLLNAVDHNTVASVYEDDDSNDFERQQDLYASEPFYGETEDEALLTPYEKPYRLENWDEDDLVAYVGGIYAKEAYSK